MNRPVNRRYLGAKSGPLLRVTYAPVSVVTLYRRFKSVYECPRHNLPGRSKREILLEDRCAHLRIAALVSNKLSLLALNLCFTEY